MKKYIFISLFILSVTTVFAQTPVKNEALAKHYYSTGNYEKAAILLEDIIKKPNNRYFYSLLFNSLLKLNEYDKLEKIVKKQIKKFKDEQSFQIDLAYVYSQNNQIEKSKSLNEKIISKLTASEQEIRSVAYKYISLNQNENLLKTYEKGNKLFKDDSKFAFDIGETYIRLNKFDIAINYWLKFAEKYPERLSQIQSSFSRNLEKNGFQIALEENLYENIQDKPNNNLYPELLIWLFINQKDFENALTQAKALDKRNKDESYRIFQLSQTALKEKEYQVAINGYNYLIEKGENSEFFRIAKSGILKSRKLKILNGTNYTKEDLLLLKKDYLDYLETYGKSIANAKTIRELANLEAKYLDNVNEGIVLIEELLKNTRIKKKLKNILKLDLGDMYILKGDVWEAVLIYSQVDKDENDSPLGEDARFRNAKLSYYIGEFEWAQAQLIVLKGATTELIANDALKLSVFIIDNLGLDTSSMAIKMFSEAELLMIQNKKEEAILLLDEILQKFPQHALEDDVMFKKAKIYISNRNFLKAENILLELLNSYSTDILGDNATFLLAELYKNELNNKEKAKEYYKNIITHYSNSIFLMKSRINYRELRGDKL